MYLLVFGGMIFACVVTGSLFRHPTRVCHRCGARVRLGHRRCRDCLYEFTN